jgi:N-acetylglucosaminyldiphosphoundecaprenol N-acetyl-beta-D-mannosaminyltransferase
MRYSLYTGKLADLPTSQKLLVSCLNQYTYCIAEEDVQFKEALLNSEVLLPDGIGIVAAEKFLNGKRIKKIAGADLHLHLLRQLNETAGRCFYLGSADATLQKIKERLAVEFPAIQVGFYAPPHATQFSEAESSAMVEAVNAFNPDVLFIGMTAPKQEKWAHAHKAQLNVRAICCIGAVFDFYAGIMERPSSFMISIGLEWFGRLVSEPKRLWRRYLYYGPIFVWLLFKAKKSAKNRKSVKI